MRISLRFKTSPSPGQTLPGFRANGKSGSIREISLTECLALSEELTFLSFLRQLVVFSIIVADTHVALLLSLPKHKRELELPHYFAAE
jgi:hypothetical protein